MLVYRTEQKTARRLIIICDLLCCAVLSCVYYVATQSVLNAHVQCVVHQHWRCCAICAHWACCQTNKSVRNSVYYSIQSVFGGLWYVIENGKIASKLSPLAICAKCLAMIRWLAGVCVVFLRIIFGTVVRFAIVVSRVCCVYAYSSLFFLSVSHSRQILISLNIKIQTHRIQCKS